MAQVALPLFVASTAVMAVSQIAGGFAGRAAAEGEARQLKVQARQEKLAAQQRAVQIRNQTSAVLASQRALLASRGIDIGDTGTPATLALQTIKMGERDILYNTANMQSRISQIDFARQQARQRGSAALFGGFTGAFGSVAQGGLALATLGGAPQSAPLFGGSNSGMYHPRQ